MFSLVKDIDEIRVNVDDVSTNLFRDNVITDVSLTLGVPENRLTDYTYLCIVREHKDDLCISHNDTVRKIISECLSRECLSEGQRISLSRKEMDKYINLNIFENLCFIIGLYKNGESCTGWSSKVFKTYRGDRHVSSNK